MSVCENKTKNGRLTFSDQITSRLHRWVQRTTTKGREREKGDVSIKKLQRESNHVKENDLNVRQSPPRDKIPGHSDTRTILELEKALQDLISNCVTNAAAASSLTRSCTSVQLTMTTKDIERENGDANGVGTRRGEKCGNGDIGHRTRKSRHGRNVNEMVQVSRLDETQGNYASCEVTIPGAGASTDKQVGVGQKSSAFSTRDHVKDAQVKDQHLGENASTNNVNERNSSYQTEQENTKASEARNRPSSSGVTEADASAGNANNGLSGGSSIKTQPRRISRTGRNGTLSRRSKTLDGQEIDVKNWSPMAAKQRPPLRRIQSEGDSISKRFSFKDDDVSEFAETCIRHAQRKRLSQAISIDSDAGSLSEMVFGEAVGRGQQRLSRRSEFAVSRRLPLRFPARDSGNVSDYEPGSPDVTASRPSDDHDALRTAQHPPLSDRRSFFGDVDRSLQASRLSPQCGISRKHRSGTRDSGNVSDFEPGSPDITASRPSDQHTLHTVQHTPLSAQPSSLSFPLEKNMAKDANKQSFFKPKSKSKTPSEGSCSPQSPKRSAISPKFKKFPYQPMFYVPQAVDSSSPLPVPPKMNRSRSLTESKPVNVEHLIWW